MYFLFLFACMVSSSADRNCISLLFMLFFYLEKFVIRLICTLSQFILLWKFFIDKICVGLFSQLLSSVLICSRLVFLPLLVSLMFNGTNFMYYLLFCTYYDWGKPRLIIFIIRMMMLSMKFSLFDYWFKFININ